MTETRQFFATPFLIDRLQSAAGIGMLRDAIDTEMMRDTSGISISNLGGWHSNTHMIEWGGEAAKALAFKANGAPLSSEISVRPQTGMIVMFPSWLQHAVRPFHGLGTRVSIAINLVAAMKKPH